MAGTQTRFTIVHTTSMNKQLYSLQQQSNNEHLGYIYMATLHGHNTLPIFIFASKTLQGEEGSGTIQYFNLSKCIQYLYRINA